MSIEIPDFIEPHDGAQQQVPKVEKSVVSSKFANLVGDLLLNHADDVNYFDFTKENSLVLSTPVIEGDQWTISVKDRSIDDAEVTNWQAHEVTTKQVSLQKISQGFGREYFSYRMGKDGVVRRWDGGDIYGKKLRDQELGIEQPKMLDSNARPDEIHKATLELLKSMREDLIPNSRLETDMGLNNQPIDSDEIDGLVDFVKQQKLAPRFPRFRK